MWAATLLTSAAAAFGRLLSVNLLPCALLAYSILVSIRGFVLDRDDRLKAADVLIFSGKADSLAVLLAIVFVALLAVLTQTFQYGIVRLFEGYWQRYPAFAKAAERAKNRHLRRFEKRKEQLASRDRLEHQGARRRADAASMGGRRQRRLQAEERRIATAGARADGELSVDFPPKSEELLPTRLGNAMRAFERRAGERYGYDTIVTWPRLYPHISERLIAAVHSATDALHAALNFTIAFMIAAFAYLVSFIDDPAYLPLAGFCMLAAYLSYRGSVAAARSVGLATFVAFDLHRFDMLTGLSLPLPANGEIEHGEAARYSQFFRRADLDESIMRAKALWYSH